MKLEHLIRDNAGRFKPVYKEWNFNNFDEGYVNCHGRFVVRKPNHHRANRNGWVKRSIIAYEFYNNDIVTKEYDIHHKDKNKLNDKKDNLEKLLHNEHSIISNKGLSRKKQNERLRRGKYLICPVCKKEFYRPQWVINHNKSKINICSRFCNNNRKKILDYRNGIIYA